MIEIVGAALKILFYVVGLVVVTTWCVDGIARDGKRLLGWLRRP